MKKPLLATYALNSGIDLMNEEDAKKLDILYIGFGRPTAQSIIDVSEITLISKIKQIKQWNKDLLVVLSVASSGTFSFAQLTTCDENILSFVQSTIKYLKEHDLDGLDIDWEWPVGESEKKAYSKLIYTFRKELDKEPKKYDLSIAAGTKTWFFEITDLTNDVQYLDYVNLMTYDMNCNSKYAIHHSCNFPMKSDLEDTNEGSIQENIELFIANGVPAEKLIVGAAFYGRQWVDVENKNNGLYSFSGKPCEYAPEYTGLVNNCINKNGYTKYYDEVAQAPYLFNGSTFITYDDAESLTRKCELVKDTGIAGIMSWHYSADTTGELLNTMYNTLKK